MSHERAKLAVTHSGTRLLSGDSSPSSIIRVCTIKCRPQAGDKCAVTGVYVGQ